MLHVMLLTSEVTITSYAIKWQNPIAKIMTLRELKALKSNTAFSFQVFNWCPKLCQNHWIQPFYRILGSIFCRLQSPGYVIACTRWSISGNYISNIVLQSMRQNKGARIHPWIQTLDNKFHFHVWKINIPNINFV